MRSTRGPTGCSCWTTAVPTRRSRRRKPGRNSCADLQHREVRRAVQVPVDQRVHRLPLEPIRVRQDLVADDGRGRVYDAPAGEKLTEILRRDGRALQSGRGRSSWTTIHHPVSTMCRDRTRCQFDECREKVDRRCRDGSSQTSGVPVGSPAETHRGRAGLPSAALLRESPVRTEQLRHLGSLSSSKSAGHAPPDTLLAEHSITEAYAAGGHRQLAHAGGARWNRSRRCIAATRP